MSAPALHLKHHDLDPGLPLRLQATSLAAELEACAVFQAAARCDLAAGDIRALARITALDEHEKQLREQLARVEHEEHRQQLP